MQSVGGALFHFQLYTFCLLLNLYRYIVTSKWFFFVPAISSSILNSKENLQGMHIDILFSWFGNDSRHNDLTEVSQKKDSLLQWLLGFFGMIGN